VERFLVETPHDPEECKLLIGYVRAQGYLHNFDWGCHFGVHTGWAVIDAETEAQASLAIPSTLRGKAKLTRVERYDDARDFHES
jgi:hypothetical protein